MALLLTMTGVGSEAYALPQRAPRAAPDPARAAPFAPSLYPSSTGSPVDCLILAPDSLVNEYQPLADFQTRTGRPTVVRGLSTVRALDPRSNDLAQAIRSFLESAYELWGIRWAILAGDHDAIPLRIVRVTYPYTEEIPTDFYYSDFDGTWDGNGNGIYGEVADSLDLDPEISVGRLSASTRAEAGVLVEKTLRYASRPAAAAIGRNLMLAEVLVPYAWKPGDVAAYDGGDYAESLVARVPACSQSDRYYENHTVYPGSQPLTKASATAALGRGYGAVAHVGHGARSQISVGSEVLTGAELGAIDNGDSASLWVVNNCASAGLDYDCVAEQLTRRPRGGALAFIGATRDAWPDNSASISNRLFEELYGGGAVTLGEALESARSTLLPAARNQTNARWGIFETVLLGVPSLTIWRCPPETLLVSAPPSVALDAGSFTVQVSADGAPVESALVVAWKAGEDFRSILTDAAGQAAIPFHPATTGPFSIAVVADGALPSLDSLTVTADPPPHYALEGVFIRDQLGGDGDGLAGAGEIFALGGTIRNSGGSPSAGPLSVAFESITTGLSIEKGSGGAPPLAMGATTPLPDSLRVRALAMPDAARTERLRVIVGDGSAADTTEVTIEVTAASALLAGSVFSDAAGGDGDGVLEAGETASLSWSVGNAGGGRARSLAAHLDNPGPGITLIDTDGSVGDVAPGSAASTPALRFQAASVPSRLFDLTLTDAYGHSRTFAVERSAPEAPAGLFVEASDVSRITIGWSAVAAADLLGYHVYRALDDGSVLASVTPIPVRRVPAFEDQDLSQLTRYRYQVSAIDSSGNEGSRSTVLLASTTPPAVPGWPASVAASTSSNVCLADLDGDDRPEVLVGAQSLYVFRPDGTDWRDGDQNPVTTGVFTTLLHNIPSSPAAADLDFDGTPEIIAASWNDSTVAAFRSDGTLMPGWPKKGAAPFWSSPAVGDIDGDGVPEICIGSNAARFYAWHADGSEVLDGDGNPATDGVLTVPVGNVISSPAIADLDRDGGREVIFGSSGGRVYALRAQGSLPGWPFSAGGMMSSSPAVGDIVPGGGLEVAMGCSNDSVYVLTSDGARAPGWPVPLELTPGNGRVPSAALAPLLRHLGDESLCVVISGWNGQVRAFGASGNLLPGWGSVQLGDGAATEASPAVADLDGDGSLEVLIGAEDRRLYAFHHDGSPVSGFPIEIGAEVRGTPAVWDLDGDGATEILVAGWDGKVHAWRYPGSFGAEGMAWPMFRHDNWHTGMATFPILTSVLPLPESPPLQSPPPRAFLEQNRPNPFNPETTIGFSVPGTAPSMVTLRIYTAAGRLVRTLVSRRVDPGYHEVRWDARDDRGLAAASGIYIYRAEIGSAILTRKLALLR